MNLNPAVTLSNPARHLDQYRHDWKRYAECQDGYHPGGDPTRELRRAAWEEFQQLGFPIHRRGNELWKYTDLRPIDRIGFRLSVGEDRVAFGELAERLPLREDTNCAVFVNGFLQEIRGDGAVTRIQACDWIGDIARYAGDPFVSLNTAFMSVRGGAYCAIRYWTPSRNAATRDLRDDRIRCGTARRIPSGRDSNGRR